MNLFIPPKLITLTLVGLDGNAFSLMGAFERQAKREGWNKEEINQVLDECMSGDYNHLLYILSEHCMDEEQDDYNEYDTPEYNWD